MNRKGVYTMNNPEIGAKATRQLTVTKDKLASSVGSGTVDVFATPMVAALMEGAACDLAARYIEDIYTTVGSEICVQHLCPTAEGVIVTAQAELTKADGRFFEFKLTATDNAGVIATGTHTRVSVKKESFAKKALDRKLQ